MLPVSARKELDRAIGAEIAAASLLAHAGVEPAAIELVDLYSCFPIAVRVHAEALGLSTERDLTLTGGMPFAGGPYNNYQLQAIARAATLLRAGSGKFALVSGVSGILTKHGFGIWSASPPSRTFERIDVTDKVARATSEVEVVEGYQGVATVRAFTVLHETGHDQRLLALLDTPEGKRVIISSTDRQWVVRAQQRDLIGHAVRVAGSGLIE
jgi:acetyl-CoA C-acetyltransferase